MQRTTWKMPALFALTFVVGLLGSRLVRAFEKHTQRLVNPVPAILAKPSKSGMVKQAATQALVAPLRNDQWVKLYDPRCPQFSLQRMLERLRNMSPTARWQLAEQLNQMMMQNVDNIPSEVWSSCDGFYNMWLRVDPLTATQYLVTRPEMYNGAVYTNGYRLAAFQTMLEQAPDQLLPLLPGIPQDYLGFCKEELERYLSKYRDQGPANAAIAALAKELGVDQVELLDKPRLPAETPKKRTLQQRLELLATSAHDALQLAMLHASVEEASTVFAAMSPAQRKRIHAEGGLHFELEELHQIYQPSMSPADLKAQMAGIVKRAVERDPETSIAKARLLGKPDLIEWVELAVKKHYRKDTTEHSLEFWQQQPASVEKRQGISAGIVNLAITNLPAALQLLEAEPLDRQLGTREQIIHTLSMQNRSASLQLARVWLQNDSVEVTDLPWQRWTEEDVKGTLDLFASLPKSPSLTKVAEDVASYWSEFDATSSQVWAGQQGLSPETMEQLQNSVDQP